MTFFNGLYVFGSGSVFWIRIWIQEGYWIRILIHNFSQLLLFLKPSACVVCIGPLLCSSVGCSARSRGRLRLCCPHDTSRVLCLCQVCSSVCVSWAPRQMLRVSSSTRQARLVFSLSGFAGNVTAQVVKWRSAGFLDVHQLFCIFVLLELRTLFLVKLFYI